jgi:hypothetical protein
MFLLSQQTCYFTLEMKSSLQPFICFKIFTGKRAESHDLQEDSSAIGSTFWDKTQTPVG